MISHQSKYSRTFLNDKENSIVLAEANNIQVQHSKEENLKDLAKKVNADKVKRNLNCEINVDNKENIKELKGKIFKNFIILF